MLVNLKDILPAAASTSYIVPGFNVFGLDENISRTRVLADVAHNKVISIEGEIGSVPYP